MKNNFLKAIDSSWTLFLDRDGVLNVEIDKDYVRNWQQFHFFDTTLPAMKMLAEMFSKILIVTNQRGVGVELMSLADLHDIHQKMTSEIIQSGGRIDKIYYCTDVDRNSPNRKPLTGMGLQAKNDFPQIDFHKSIMVGNNISDMQFGRNLNMYTIFIDDKKQFNNIPSAEMDLIFDDLLQMADYINTIKKAASI